MHQNHSQLPELLGGETLSIILYVWGRYFVLAATQLPTQGCYNTPAVAAAPPRLLHARAGTRARCISSILDTNLLLQYSYCHIH